MNPDGPQPADGGYTGSIEGLGGVGALFGGFYDTYQSTSTAKRNTDRTIEAQRAEAEKAYQRQVQMWEMQNAYNSPAEQMKRFGAAGLNPNLIYGQGSSGNANKFPEYQAPNLQYRYEAPTYGAAVNSLLPTLMGVGTWMQNMRLSETQIREKETGMDKTKQMIEYLSSVNPRNIESMDNKLSTFPYQRSAMRNLAEKGNIGITDMLEEFRYKWGNLGNKPELEFGDVNLGSEGLGARGLEYRTKGVEFLRKLAESRLSKNKADWSDYGITDPQSAYGLLLRSVMGLTGRMMSKGPVNQKVREIGKGNRGRWSMPAKRWIPTKTRSGQWKSETP